MEVRLQGQRGTVTLTKVEADDEARVAGFNKSGKRFVTRRDRINDVEIPDRAPYRVYLTNTVGEKYLRVVGPSFEEAEEWVLGTDDTVGNFVLTDGEAVVLSRDEVLSLLSARPVAVAVGGDDYDEDEDEFDSDSDSFGEGQDE